MSILSPQVFLGEAEDYWFCASYQAVFVLSPIRRVWSPWILESCIMFPLLNTAKIVESSLGEQAGICRQCLLHAFGTGHS